MSIAWKHASLNICHCFQVKFMQVHFFSFFFEILKCTSITWHISSTSRVRSLSLIASRNCQRSMLKPKNWPLQRQAKPLTLKMPSTSFRVINCWTTRQMRSSKMGCNCAFPIQVSVYFENLKIILYHIIYESLKQLYFTCFCWRIIKVVSCCCYCHACWWYAILLSRVLISLIFSSWQNWDWSNTLVLNYGTCVVFCMSRSVSTGIITSPLVNPHPRPILRNRALWEAISCEILSTRPFLAKPSLGASIITNFSNPRCS